MSFTLSRLRERGGVRAERQRKARRELLRNPDIDARTLAEMITRRLQRNEQSRITHWSRLGMLAPPHRASD